MNSIRGFAACCRSFSTFLKMSNSCSGERLLRQFVQLQPSCNTDKEMLCKKVRILLENGADPEEKDENGKNALQLAATIEVSEIITAHLRRDL